MTRVTNQLKILGCDLINIGLLALPLQFRERLRLAQQLGLERLHMVAVNVCVAYLEDELVRLSVGHFGQDVGEQGVGRNVERHAQTHICGALVHEARQFWLGGIGCGQRHVELTEHVARW